MEKGQADHQSEVSSLDLGSDDTRGVQSDLDINLAVNGTFAHL